MRIRVVALMALAAGAVGAALAADRAFRRRETEEAAAPRQAFGEPLRIDAAPLVVVRAVRGVVEIGAAPDGRVEVSETGGQGPGDAVEVSREDGGARLVLAAQPRSSLRILVPAGSALRLEVVRSAVRVNGIDDVDLRCVRSSVKLGDVAGAVTVHSTRAAVRVDLARNRRTRSVDMSATRSALTFVLPPDRGGFYNVDQSSSSVIHPAPEEGGIPFVVQAARAAIAIRPASLN